MINANDWSSSRALPQQYTFHAEIQIQTLTQIHYTSTPASAGAAHFGPHWFTLFYYSHCLLHLIQSFLLNNTAHCASNGFAFVLRAPCGISDRHN